eukprot:TRINITY_DN9832_c0_g2_i1.p1 TRINITY_DN9832_c0_g2~~TRINITY_DN9832_c0_g2_i1.p1  ORF type:complete len:387 (-),score=45.47 TRINITY_DN9832_c0_g2_i1:163-1323(-)
MICWPAHAVLIIVALLAVASAANARSIHPSASSGAQGAISVSKGSTFGALQHEVSPVATLSSHEDADDYYWYDESATPPPPPEKHYIPLTVLFPFIIVCASVMALIAYVLRDYGSLLSVATKDSDVALGAQAGDVEASADPKGMKRELTLGACRDGHRVPWQQYLALAFWFLLLLTQAAFTRWVCHLGIPRDCKAHLDPVKLVHNVHLLIAYGFVVAVLTDLQQPERFGYLFSFREYPYRGVSFVVVFFLASPVFGSLDLVPFLKQVSLVTDGSHSLLNNSLLVVLFAGFLALALWHFWWAYRCNPLPGFVAYSVSRLLLWCVYVAYFVVAARDLTITFHMHHYLVGFLLAILAEFNHPVSLLLLSIGSGVMVQGIAAYDADPLLN